ncbi:MAG: PIG-L family deacetylase [Cyanobacteria bacterium SZAS-4]|nr:PIG-L family deacetylase [Cyanobacteria bacterium SZAS-4]
MSLLIFGAHPDDIEFGCGGVVARETQSGRSVHFVVGSLGEAGSNGTPEQRAEESTAAAKLLGASIEFIELDGDSHLEIRSAHALRLASIIRRMRPETLLAPSCVENQHPDHSRLGQLVRDAARLARYGGLKELSDHKTHAVKQLFFYAVTPDGEPRDIPPVLIDISAPEVVSAWTAAMNAHRSQAATRNYVDLQLTRAKLFGARAGVEYAMAVYPNDPMVFDSLADAGRGARRF